MICKNIHQIWIGDQLPDKYNVWIDTTKQHHPEWNYKLWTGSDITQLINDTFPEMLSVYNEYKYTIQRCDVARLFILYKFGGLYSDLDIQFFKSVEQLIKLPCVLFLQYPDDKPCGYRECFPRYIPTITNSIFYASKHNKFIRNCITNLKLTKDIKKRDGEPSVMMSTSPGFLTRMYHRYKCVNNIDVLPFEHFEMIPKTERVKLVDTQLNVCDEMYGMHWNVCSWNKNSWHV